MNIDLKLFSEQEVNDIYKKYVVKDESYYSKANERFNRLPIQRKQKYRNNDFPRIASLFDFEDWIQKYNLTKVDSLLSTFEGDYELEHIEVSNLKVCKYVYNSTNKNDLHLIDNDLFDQFGKPLDKKDFDFIIFNQTLEHVYNPFIVMKNLYNRLKPGGYLYTTVPTINIPHEVPFHFWGITPIGLCMLSKSVGFDICECGYWGNYEYLGHLFTYNGWPGVDDVRDDNGKINNTDLCQAQTWILVQK